MRTYEDTMVSESSQLGQALENRQRGHALHQRIYNETTKNFRACFGKDAKWFEAQHKGEQSV